MSPRIINLRDPSHALHDSVDVDVRVWRTLLERRPRGGQTPALIYDVSVVLGPRR